MTRTSHNEAIIISKHYSIWWRSTANVLRISLSCHVVDLQHIVVTLTCPIAQLIPCQLITRHMIRTSHNAPIIVFVFCVWNWQPYLSISPRTWHSNKIRGLVPLLRKSMCTWRWRLQSIIVPHLLPNNFPRVSSVFSVLILKWPGFIQWFSLDQPDGGVAYSLHCGSGPV